MHLQTTQFMLSERARLHQFLQIKAGPSASARVDQVMEDLEPFFRIAEQQVFPFGGQSEVDPDQLGAAITKATGASVLRLTPASLEECLQHAADRCRCGEPSHHRAVLADRFEQLLDETSWERIIGEVRSDPREVSGLSVELSGVLYDCLVSRLERVLRQQAGFWAQSLNVTLLIHLLACVRGYDDWAERVRGIVRLSTKVIPIGESKEDKGTWIILTA